jgi:hypothetical protein
MALAYQLVSLLAWGAVHTRVRCLSDIFVRPPVGLAYQGGCFFVMGGGIVQMSRGGGLVGLPTVHHLRQRELDGRFPRRPYSDPQGRTNAAWWFGAAQFGADD